MRVRRFILSRNLLDIRVSDWHYRWFSLYNKVYRLRFKLFFCGGSQENRYPRQEDLVLMEKANEPAGLGF